MDLENMLNERSQSQKYHLLFDFIYMKCPEQENPYRQKINQWLSGVGGREEQEMTGYEVLEGNKNVQKLC